MSRVPIELINLLNDFICEVFAKKPEDIAEFAAIHFTFLKEEKRKANNELKMLEKQEHKDMDSSATLESSSTSAEFIKFNKRSKLERSCRLVQRRNSIAGESFGPLDIDTNFLDNKETCYPKSKPVRNRLENILKKIFIFKSCGVDQLEMLINHMYERKVFAGEIIVRQGDPGENFYVVDKGKFDVNFEDGDCKQNLAQIEGPGSFGELALMYNCPRSASVIAKEDGVIWVLDRFTFRRILFTTTENKRRHYEHLLENMPILSLLNAYERAVLADALETKVFEDNNCIIKEGDTADCMYFIENGRVAISVQDEQEEDKRNMISYAEKGDYFGELALVYKRNRIASVHAEGEVTCAYLDINAFERLLGPCKDLMKRNAEKYENQRKLLGIRELNY